jgi:hypothetical protein
VISKPITQISVPAPQNNPMGELDRDKYQRLVELAG